MNYSFLIYIGMACALCISAVGSGFGAGMASLASVGGWKKCYANGKQDPFILVGFAGAPLTQIIYGFLLMNFISAKLADPSLANGILSISVGLLAGVVIGLSAFFQGKVAASAADALAETGKGTAKYFIVIGIVETVALFTLVLGMLLLNK